MNPLKTIRRLRELRRRRLDPARRPAARWLEALEPRCVLSAHNPTIELPDAQTLFEGQAFDLTAIFQDADPADTYFASINWGDGQVDSLPVDTSSAFNTPLTVRIDYSLDTNNFFDTQEKRDTLQLAADTLVSRFADTLSAIIPGPAGSLTNTWQAILTHPGTGEQIMLTDLSIASNELVVYAGGRFLDAPSLGAGGFGGFTSSGTQAFVDAVETRGEVGAGNEGAETDFGPWGGSISFSTRSAVKWHFGATTDELGPGETDFFTVAMHEMGHLFGFGTSNSFKNQTDLADHEFTGANSVTEYDEDGNPPLNDGNDHWKDSIKDEGLETSMDPTIGPNKRKLFTPLDFAAMDDIGWTVVPERQGSVSAGHTFADNGVYTVSLTVTDSGGGESTETLDITVENVAPNVTTRDIETTHVGELLSILDIATFTDLGFNNDLANPATSETFTYTINWGDGTINSGDATVDSQGGPGSPTAGSLNGSHTYTTADPFSVTVTVTDDDGDSDSGTFFVAVFDAVDAVNDEFFTNEDTPIVVPASELFDNDGGGPLSVTAVNGGPQNVGASLVLPSGATLLLDANGRIDYDPTTSAALNALAEGQMADDSFTYTVSDGRSAFSTATVTIHVSGLSETAKAVRLDPRIVLSPTSADSSGHVEQPPAGEAWIDEWRTFYLEIWVRVENSTLTGVSNASITLSYESDYFTPQSINGGAAFDNGFNSSTNDSQGRINITTGANVGSLAGAGEFALLARVRFAPTADKPGVPIHLDEAGPVRAADEGWLTLTTADITLAGSVSVSSVQQSDMATELWPMLYDLDDDQRVGFGDLSLFSGVFLQSVNLDSQLAAKADFDLSGRVDFGDMSLLSPNFLKTRASKAPIVFPINFPEEWRTTPSPASSSSPPATPALLMEAAAPAGKDAVAGAAVMGATPASANGLANRAPFSAEVARSNGAGFEANKRDANGRAVRRLDTNRQTGPNHSSQDALNEHSITIRDGRNRKKVGQEDRLAASSDPQSAAWHKQVDHFFSGLDDDWRSTGRQSG